MKIRNAHCLVGIAVLVSVLSAAWGCGQPTIDFEGTYGAWFPSLTLHLIVVTDFPSTSAVVTFMSDGIAGHYEETNTGMVSGVAIYSFTDDGLDVYQGQDLNADGAADILDKTMNSGQPAEPPFLRYYREG
jgi:hypothetical protein